MIRHITSNKCRRIIVAVLLTIFLLDPVMLLSLRSLSASDNPLDYEKMSHEQLQAEMNKINAELDRLKIKHNKAFYQVYDKEKIKLVRQRFKLEGAILDDQFAIEAGEKAIKKIEARAKADSRELSAAEKKGIADLKKEISNKNTEISKLQQGVRTIKSMEKTLIESVKSRTNMIIATHERQAEKRPCQQPLARHLQLHGTTSFRKHRRTEKPCP